MRNDVVLYGDDKIKLNFDMAMKFPNLIKYVRITLSWQKNGDHNYTAGAPEIMHNYLSTKSLNGSVFYKDSFAYEVAIAKTNR